MAADDTTEALIVGLYDAALEPDRWDACFAAIRRAIGADTSMSSLIHPARGAVQVLACNAPDAFVRGYMETWWTKDLWMIEAARRAGRIVVGSEMLPDEEFRRSEVFHELVQPTSDVRDVLGTVFDLGAWRVVIGLHRPAAGTYGVTERARFRTLLPHVARSLEVTLRFEELGRLGGASQSALDALPYGVLVVDRQCRPVVTNRLADEIVAAGDGLVAGTAPAGAGWRPLAARRPADTARLHELVLAATDAVPGPGGAMRIARAGPGADYAVLVAPAVGRRATLFNHGAATALIIVQDPAGMPAPPARVLRDLYGLTEAEAAIVVGLATGSSPETVAETRGVSIATLRSQIRSILAKTGVGRLTDLARLVAALPRMRS